MASLSLHFTRRHDGEAGAGLWDAVVSREDELGEVGEAAITLKDGRKSRVTMHLIEGSKEQIEETLRQSVEAFFEMYPEI